MTSREKMLEDHLKGRGINDPKVLQAMEQVDRRLFVPDELKDMAYDDTPLPIGRNQTISQPYIVAYMAQILDLQPDDKVLEIGAGCGYNAAVMSRIVTHVYSMEIIEWLAKLARENLKAAGIENVTARYGDGYIGWPANAPYDKIVLTAAPSEIPGPLKEQLRIGGRILAPVSNTFQKLILLEKKDRNDFREHDLIHVRFVPMTGESQREKE